MPLADISGHTSFLQTVAAAHRDDAFADGRVPDAYGLVASLLEGIIERIVPPLTYEHYSPIAARVYALR